MNEKFWQLPAEKQNRIINGGLEVFARNEYKKAPMSEIAAAAGISKSLLFHYFVNKKELYLFLYDYAADFMRKKREEDVVMTRDFMDMFQASLISKCKIAREYPYMNQFVIQAYFEDEPEIKEELMSRNGDMIEASTEKILKVLDLSKFREGTDVRQLLKHTVWIAEGYLFHQMRSGNMDVDQWEKDYMEMIEFWRKNHYA